jgi:hypothetical protein
MPGKLSRIGLACGLLAAGTPQVASLTVTVQPGSSECFALHLDKGASFSGNYEVLTEDFDLSAVDVKVSGPPTAPHQTTLYASAGLEEGSFAAEAADPGDQSMCLTNTDPSLPVTLGFALRADADLLVADSAKLEAATEENLKSMFEVHKKGVRRVVSTQAP